MASVTRATAKPDQTDVHAAVDLGEHTDDGRVSRGCTQRPPLVRQFLLRREGRHLGATFRTPKELEYTTRFGLGGDERKGSSTSGRGGIRMLHRGSFLKALATGLPFAESANAKPDLPDTFARHLQVQSVWCMR